MTAQKNVETKGKINGAEKTIKHHANEFVVFSPFDIYPGYIILKKHLSPTDVFTYDKAQRSRANITEEERDEKPTPAWQFENRRSFISKISIEGIEPKAKSASDIASYPVLDWINSQTRDVWNSNIDPKGLVSQSPGGSDTPEPKKPVA